MLYSFDGLLRAELSKTSKWDILLFEGPVPESMEEAMANFDLSSTTADLHNKSVGSVQAVYSASNNKMKFSQVYHSTRNGVEDEENEYIHPNKIEFELDGSTMPEGTRMRAHCWLRQNELVGTMQFARTDIHGDKAIFKFDSPTLLEKLRIYTAYANGINIAIYARNEDHEEWVLQTNKSYARNTRTFTGVVGRYKQFYFRSDASGRGNYTSFFMYGEHDEPAAPITPTWALMFPAFVNFDASRTVLLSVGSMGDDAAVSLTKGTDISSEDMLALGYCALVSPLLEVE